MILPTIPSGFFSSWAQFTVLSNDRDALSTIYKSQGIPTSVYYGRCVHQQSAFDSLNSSAPADCPTAEGLAKKVLSLPMHPYIDNVKVVATQKAR